MEGALSLIGLAVAALLAVAIAVAWWEQTAAAARPVTPPKPQQTPAVDVHLDHLADTPPPGDQAARDAVMGHAMARMAEPAPSSIAWMETRPMVAPGAPAETRPSARA